MFIRVVRFTDVDPGRRDAMLAQIQEHDGPPEGVKSPKLQILFDDGQRTAVVLQHFETAEDMQAGAKVLSAMDSSQTPGTRASVDECELKLELNT